MVVEDCDLPPNSILQSCKISIQLCKGRDLMICRVSNKVIEQNTVGGSEVFNCKWLNIYHERTWKVKSTSISSISTICNLLIATAYTQCNTSENKTL
jgi:hypothetical protein